MMIDSELLVGLSIKQLEALAEGMLAPAAQANLHDLLERNKEKTLSANDEKELDRILEMVDELTILKARAKFTLEHDKMAATRT